MPRDAEQEMLRDGLVTRTPHPPYPSPTRPNPPQPVMEFNHRDRQRQTDRQTERQTGRQTDGQIQTEANRQTDGQTDGWRGPSQFWLKRKEGWRPNLGEISGLVGRRRGVAVRQGQSCAFLEELEEFKHVLQ